MQQSNKKNKQVSNNDSLKDSQDVNGARFIES